MYKILIVEDDNSIHVMMHEYLEKKQYICIDAYSGTEAMLLIKAKKPDLVLLDLMLPGLDGEDVLTQIKKENQIPIIVVSAKDSIQNKVELFNRGADDYMTKPFALEELEARIQVQLRKNQSLFDQDLCVEDMRLLSDQKTLQIENQMITLTRHEYKIMELLMQYPKRAFSKKEIYEYAWDDFFAADDKTVSVHVSNIRNKVKNRELIDTVWGIGFKLHQERE